VNDRILGPTSEINLTTILDRIKRETMYAINCVMIGTIESYNTLTYGSLKSTIPISFKTFVKNRLYSKCKIAWVTPPTY